MYYVGLGTIYKYNPGKNRGDKSDQKQGRSFFYFTKNNKLYIVYDE